jgi:hypothetical protein
LVSFVNNLAGILLPEPSSCHHATSNQIESVHLFLSLSHYATLLSPPPPRGGTQDANMINVKHTTCLKGLSSEI